MPAPIAVRIRSVPRVTWFDCAGTGAVPGDHVIVETDKGPELGTVVDECHHACAEKAAGTLKPIVRLATAEDLQRAADLAEKEGFARARLREMIQAHKLDMKPVGVEYLFSGDKVIFYFTAEERIDFRELVRNLASELKARVEMRQIGVRDEARMLGGVGHCGEQLCCARMGQEFQPVSIRMAKEQDLSLNPLKISGLCGRLMCCLRYEFEAYKDFKSRAPRKGTKIETPDGEGVVVGLDTPREQVKVALGSASPLVVPLSAIKCGKGKGCPCSISKEALEEISAKADTGVSAIFRDLPGVPGEAGAAKKKPEAGAAKAKPQAGTGKRSKRAASPSAEKPAEKPGEKPERSGSGRRRRRRRSGGQGAPPASD